jgi:phosphonate transport system ATP-binding protein
MPLALVREDEAARAPRPAPVKPVLRINGLAKSFSGRSVMSGVDLDVAPGAAVALIGANGAGKSTLLRMLVRLIEPDAGSIELLGEKVTALDASALRRFRRRVGIVFQRHNLVGRLSALSNVIHGVQARQSGPRTWIHSLAHEDVRQEALACLAAVGLADRALQRADSLSGGQSQRVAIARMLMQRPEFILADEPDASLDPRSGEEVMDLLYRLAKEKGLTLIVISHRLEHTIRYSDRIVGLHGGSLTLDLSSSTADPQHLRSFFSQPDAAP